MQKQYKKIWQRAQLRFWRFLVSHGVSDYSILIFFSILLGIIAGLAAVGFHETIGWISEFSFENRSHQYWIIAIPALGMLIQWIMIKIAPRQSKERGVLELIKAISLKNGNISLKTTIFHFLAPAISMGTGATVGPEAPAAQTGAGAVSAVGRFLGLSDTRMRIFVAAGAGAAISAVFNTPLAGIFFAVEVVLLNNFNVSALGAFLLSSVSASAVSRALLGNDPKFIFSPLDLGSYMTFGFYLLLGLGAGLLSIAFIHFNQKLHKQFKIWYQTIPQWTGMLLVGLLMGLAGFSAPELLGIGYETINGILAHRFSSEWILIFLGLKFILVLLIVRSGGFGGLFAPSLFMGACYGYLFAGSMNQLFTISLDTTTYTLVGMGAVLAGVNSIPLTAIMILFEMTNNYNFILPLMLGIVGSHTITQMVFKGSIYRQELYQAGYRLSSGRESSILNTIKVESITRLNIHTIPENTPISQIVTHFLDETSEMVYTLDESGKLSGRISMGMLRYLVNDFENLQTMLVAQDVIESNVLTIDASETLDHAMRLFSRRQVEEMPVTIHHRTDQLLGILHYQDILKVYQQGMAKANLIQELAGDVRTLENREIRTVLPGFSIAEFGVPNGFVGQTLDDLKLRNHYQIDLLMVERNPGPFAQGHEEPHRIMPHKDLILEQDDRLIVYGRTNDIDRFKTVVS